MCTPEAIGDFLLTRTFGGQGGARRHRILGLGGEDHGLALAGLEVQIEARGPQQILDIIESARRLFAMLEIPVPLRLDLNGAAGAQNTIGPCAIMRSNPHAAGDRLDAERSLAARLPVVIPIGAERLDRETQSVSNRRCG